MDVTCDSLNTSSCPAGLCSALLQGFALVNPRGLRDPAVPGGSEPATLPGVLGPPAVAGRMKAESPASAAQPLPAAESREGRGVILSFSRSPSSR